MKQVDLNDFVSADVRVLIGHDRGVAIRGACRLDELDGDAEQVVVVVPEHLRTLTPSFVQGLVASSVKRLGEEKFRSHYRFLASDHLISDINAGIDRVLTSRRLSGFE